MNLLISNNSRCKVVIRISIVSNNNSLLTILLMKNQTFSISQIDVYIVTYII